MPHLKLRAASTTDLQDFHAFFSDNDVMRYWSTAPHTDLAQTKKYLRDMVDSKWNGLCDFVIEHTPPSAAPKVIGKLGLWDGHEIGFMLGRPFWVKGLMTEAMSSFLPGLWDNEEMKDTKEIVADVYPRNAACIGLLKKFGFRETGYRDKTYETHPGWCHSLDLKLERPGTATK
ncbi:MAG: hypothetical protein Q9201_000690 [Fulgogasparrea decipioides]